MFGDYAYCDRYADIANAEIGKFANIAAFARIGATDHPLRHGCLPPLPVSLGRLLGRCGATTRHSSPIADAARAIGHDTWIGAGAMIKPEVTLGHGAVVAAGAVVTKDVAPYTIVAGMPAKPLRLRQPPRDRRPADRAWRGGIGRTTRCAKALDDFRALEAEAFLEKYE